MSPGASGTSLVVARLDDLADVDGAQHGPAVGAAPDQHDLAHPRLHVEAARQDDGLQRVEAVVAHAVDARRAHGAADIDLPRRRVLERDDDALRPQDVPGAGDDRVLQFRQRLAFGPDATGDPHSDEPVRADHDLVVHLPGDEELHLHLVADAEAEHRHIVGPALEAFRLVLHDRQRLARLQSPAQAARKAVRSAPRIEELQPSIDPPWNVVLPPREDEAEQPPPASRIMSRRRVAAGERVASARTTMMFASTIDASRCMIGEKP